METRQLAGMRQCIGPCLSRRETRTVVRIDRLFAGRDPRKRGSQLSRMSSVHVKRLTSAFARIQRRAFLNELSDVTSYITTMASALRTSFLGTLQHLSRPALRCITMRSICGKCELTFSAGCVPKLQGNVLIVANVQTPDARIDSR